MTVDPTLGQILDDSALMALFAASVAAGDSWESQRILSDVVDVDRARCLLGARRPVRQLCVGGVRRPRRPMCIS
jgi:hypothetical protein